MPAPRQSVKNKRAADKAAEWLKQMGVSADAIETAKEVHSSKQTKDEVSYEAEAVLSFLDKPVRFVEKTCKKCGEPFLTNYKANAYCEDACRKKALADIGIEWDPYSDAKQRWGGEPPMTIPTDAIQSLLRAAQFLQERGLIQTAESQSRTYSPREIAADLSTAEASHSHEAEELTSTAESRRPQTSEAHTNPDFSLPELAEF